MDQRNTQRMKNLILFISKKSILILMMSYTALMFSCREEEPSLGDSDLDTSVPELNELDLWIKNTFTIPYNIEVYYRWNESEFDMTRYLFPPKIENVKPMLEVVNRIWIKSYDTLNSNLIKKISPKVIYLSGGRNLNPQGTRTLGFAEGGKKVVFFEVDLQNLKTKGGIDFMMTTMQHEYTHILNQTIPFDEEGYGGITPSDYTGQWYQFSTTTARNLGFITSYARAAVTEDFAEMVQMMLTHSKDEYESIVNAISNDDGVEAIRRKEFIVAEYFKKYFAIDVYKLQAEAAANTALLITE